MKPLKNKSKERGPKKIEDLLGEGKYGYLKVIEVEPMEEVKVDINDAL